MHFIECHLIILGINISKHFYLRILNVWTLDTPHDRLKMCDDLLSVKNKINTLLS